MAILRIAIGDLDHESYKRLVDALEIATDHPLGLIMHGAGEVNGTMAVAQVWDSAEYADAFREQKLERTLAALGISAASEVTTFELTELVTP